MINILAEFGRTLLTGKTPKERQTESIVLTEQPDLLKQTWGEVQAILVGADIKNFLTEYGAWEFAGRVGETQGKAILKDDSYLGKYWTSENAAYHADVMDAHTKWEENKGEDGERRFILNVATDYRDGESGPKEAYTQLSILPAKDEVTFGELLKETGDFRQFVNNKLKDTWGGFEL